MQARKLAGQCSRWGASSNSRLSGNGLIEQPACLGDDYLAAVWECQLHGIVLQLGSRLALEPLAQLGPEAALQVNEAGNRGKPAAAFDGPPRRAKVALIAQVSNATNILSAAH